MGRLRVKRTSLLLSLLAWFVGGAAAAAELRLSFPGLPPGSQVSVAVFQNASDWKRRAQPVWAQTVSLSAEDPRLVRDLPPGDYAIMAYHDRNANGRLDTLPVGLPTEPYGFSNNSRGVFGPPGWRAATFRLSPSGADQVIRLR